MKITNFRLQNLSCNRNEESKEKSKKIKSITLPLNRMIIVLIFIKDLLYNILFNLCLQYLLLLLLEAMVKSGT